ncbi:hypothetical protein JOF41_000744 [Saccharothrix coeruleofusca]|uniref:hypothetical protein n=1 Tax=Saccharothrix coeruleofusca TaxID=33919 RepID=UPI001AE1AC6F|nr:hypothetical protein [Saccharothrix coeruleofusca]MBP2334566.1 hypothetical protein [Saccharothrix coeruleofusca]
MDDFQSAIRHAVLEALAAERRSPAVARFAQEVLDGRTDLRRTLAEAGGQDFELALLRGVEDTGAALRNVSPEDLAAMKNAVTDAYENRLRPAPAQDYGPADDGDFSDDTYLR